ncbi:general substrate transporter, partial [Anaeromyces robustus]
MKSHLKSKLYHIFSIISVASVGILHGYDLITIKLIFFFDAFRILFKLDTWDGSYRNDFGTLLSMINLDSDDNNENNSITSDTGRRFRNLKQTDNEDFIEGMITFGYIFGAIFGSYIVSQFTERKSRKLLILISTAIFSIGSFIAACSFRTGNIPFTITLARFIIGMSIGALSVVCPIYISELAPTNYRGMYIFAYHLFVIIGFIISNIIRDEPINNYYWKLLFVVQGAIGLIYSLIIYKIPESPRWLWFKEENIKARNVFLKLHGRDRETSDIKSIEEYEIIKEDAIYNRAIGYSKYSELWRPDMRRRLFTIWFLFFFQQWTGYMIYKTLGNFVLDYDAVVNMRIYMPVLLTYPFIIIVTLSSMPLVDQFGRKSLLIFGTLLLLSINGTCNERVKDRSLYISIIGQICCVIFMSVFLSTWEPIASIYQAEIFPIRIRGKGASIGIMSKYINQGLITFIGPRLLSSLGKYGFLPFAICSGISFIFISRFCPETTGITLEEIDVMI